MAINPFPRITPLDVPQAYPSAVRPDPSVWNNLASIGEAVGRERLRQQIGDLIASATDESGTVNYDRAIAALGKAGLISPQEISATGYRQKELAALEQHRRASEDVARRIADRPQYFPQQPDPIFGGGGLIEAPRVPGQPPIVHPWPVAPGTAAPVIPGPQSELEMPGAARYAAGGAGDQLPPSFYPPAGAPETPSEGPPYRVAQAGPATQPAPAQGRNDAFLATLPPQAQIAVKGVAEYDIDPDKYPGETRQRIINAAKIYRPDYSTAEYQKRASPPSGEVASRIGLAKAFIARTDSIRERIQADELNSYQGRAMALVGQGGPGELRRAIDEGSEALLRGLTGAGMSASEAANYARRYQFSLIDTKETQLRKVNELENALRYVTTEVGKGRGGEDVLKGFQSSFGQPVTTQGAARIPENAARDLRSNPQMRDEFDRKYGAGASDRVLGARR